MTEERKHPILFAATLLCARKVQPYLEGEGASCLTEHYIWRAIEQANRIVEKIDARWPVEELSPESK
jgi:hypothetical protein